MVKISNPDTNPPVILVASNYGDSNVVTLDFSESRPAAASDGAAIDSAGLITWTPNEALGPEHQHFQYVRQ